MKKLLAILLPVTIFLSSCGDMIFGNKNKSDHTKLKLTGKVKEINQKKYDAFYEGEKKLNIYQKNFDLDINKIKKDITWKETNFQFNEEGNLIEFSEYDKNRKLIDKVIYNYNDHGYLRTFKRKNDNRETSWETSYKYDKKGNETQVEQRFSHLNKRSDYQYNIDNNIVKEEYFLNGDLINYYINTYDSNGNKIMEKVYNKDHVFTYKTSYQYDNQGFVISEIKYDTLENIINKKEWKIKHKVEDILDETKKGRIETFYENDEFVSRLKYNDYNRIIEKKISYDGSAAFTYLHDEYGNWIVQIINYYDWNTKTSSYYYDEFEITERKIEYFK